MADDKVINLTVDEFNKIIKELQDGVKILNRAFNNRLKKSLQSVEKMMKNISENIQNLAKASGETNKVLSSLSTSFLYLKNSIATAVMPILQKLAPMITTVADKFASLFTEIGMVTSRILGGSTMFTGAKKAEVDYAASLEKGEKEADGKGASGVPAATDMFEEVAIPTETLAFADQLKTMLQSLADAAQPTMEAFKRLGESLEPFQQFVWTTLKDFYDQFLAPVGGWLLGQGIPRLVDAFRNGLEKIEWDKISGAFNKLWEALEPFAVHIGEGLLWLWENVLVPLGTWVMNEALPRFLEFFSGVLKVLNEMIEDLGPMFLVLWEEIFKPAAEWIGDTFIAVLDTAIGILEFLASLISGDLDQAFEGLKKAGEGLAQILENIFVAILGEECVNAIKEFCETSAADFQKWWEEDVYPWFTTERWLALFESICESFREKWQEVCAWWNKSFIKQFIDEHIAPWFTTEKWLEIMQGVASGFSQTFDNALESARTLFNRFIDWLNSNMRFEWDAIEIGGQQIAAAGSIQLFTIPHIPKLATGAVIPPNGEFLAILGDQTRGRNIEAPEGLIRQIMQEELAGMAGSDVHMNVSGNVGQIVRFLRFEIDKESNRRGKNLIKGALT